MEDKKSSPLKINTLLQNDDRKGLTVSFAPRRFEMTPVALPKDISPEPLEDKLDFPKVQKLMPPVRNVYRMPTSEQLIEDIVTPLMRKEGMKPVVGHHPSFKITEK